MYTWNRNRCYIFIVTCMRVAFFFVIQVIIWQCGTNRDNGDIPLQNLDSMFICIFNVVFCIMCYVLCASNKFQIAANDSTAFRGPMKLIAVMWLTLIAKLKHHFCVLFILFHNNRQIGFCILFCRIIFYSSKSKTFRFWRADSAKFIKIARLISFHLIMTRIR